MVSHIANGLPVHLATDLATAAADGMERTEEFMAVVVGQGIARVRLRQAMRAAGAENKMTLIDVSPHKVLPSCIQHLFRPDHLERQTNSSWQQSCCAMARNRHLCSLHAKPRAATNSACLQPVLNDVAAADLAMVVTWSAAGVAAQTGHKELRAVATMLFFG